MRVALLSCNAQAGDAIGNQVAEKLAFFRDRAADVRVFVESDHRLHPAVRPWCWVVRGAEPRGEAWRFLRGADLVVAEFGQYYGLLGLLPLLAGGKPRVLLDYHGITPPGLWGAHNSEALVKGLEHRGLAWAADATLCHSSYTRDELNRLTGLPDERLPRLGLPVDRGLFQPGVPAQDLRRQLGLGDARVLLFVGRLAPNKRPALLVEVLPLLADVAPDVHAVIVGDAGDLYQAEAQRCWDQSRRLGVADRLHLVGPRTAAELRDFYRLADILVVPSLWESFCLPVVEAMACGLPVVAARCTALPETVGSAGLTFAPDDPGDLARQLRRVLASRRAVDLPPLTPGERGGRFAARVAVVAPRFGPDLVSGLEVSLGILATALRQAGCAVEVFTTCSCDLDVPTNVLPAGTSTEQKLTVHRFPVDPRRESEPGDAPEPAGLHPFGSTALLAALAERVGELDAILVGPYLFELTAEVARRWPGQTLLVPCFHDEPAAHRPGWAKLYEPIAGILYHTAEEQAFAERVLGLNHPGAAVVGTCMPLEPAGDAERGRRRAGGAPYVLYCGRYAAEKNVALLLEYGARFCREHPDRVRFVFTGRGQVAVPDEPWALDLRVVPPTEQRDLLAGALALVQLSTRESLSLAALEAWAQGTPVIAHQDCAALAGHVRRGGGGWLVSDYAAFAATLQALLEHPEQRADRGRAGQECVRRHYGSAEALQGRLLAALAGARRPLAERLRERGLERAALFDRAAWRQQFGAVVEQVLHQPPRDEDEVLLVKPRAAECVAGAGSGAVLVAVRVQNRGTRLAVAEGPGRTVLGGAVYDADGNVVRVVEPPVALPALLMPGRALSAALAVPVPEVPGEYMVRLWARPLDRVTLVSAEEAGGAPLRLVVQRDGSAAGDGCRPLLGEAQAALVTVDQVRQLPDDYTDITQGLLAGLKRRLKGKLLGNFKKAYVDVLSRQQSQCNQQLQAAVQALAECCATLDHTVQTLQQRLARLEAAGRPAADEAATESLHLPERELESRR
jgi:glycosyltransferase involved in cell wall biosynthesis